MKLAGEVAIVTGAGSAGPGWGNGKAAAVLFAREGACVLAVDRSAEAVQETRRIIEQEGGRCATLVADVSRSGAAAAIVALCLEAYGRIDILHNNVGIARMHGLAQTEEAEWDEVFAVNVKSMYMLCRAAVPRMREHRRADGRGGRIVNVGAVAGIRWTGVPMLAYAASKAAVQSLTRSIALEHAAEGLRCNCILPGLMDTPHVGALLQGAADARILAEGRARRERQSPTGRMGDGWDVARAALFLASPDSAFVNGHALVVDGGQSQQTWSPRFETTARELTHA